MTVVIINKRHKVLIGLAFVLILGLVGGRLLFTNWVLRSLFYDKVWVHRVNSIGRLADFGESFYGVELDVVYIDSTNRFDVNHPPAESIGLSLDDYLVSHKKASALGYWVDYKNLNANNSEISCQLMDSLSKSFSLNRRKVIIESKQPLALSCFDQKGFETSYYLPPLSNVPKDSLPIVIDSIRQKLNHRPRLMISSHINDYEIMKECFPDRKKLLWATGGYGGKNRYEIQWQWYSVLMDKQVEIVLLPYFWKSPYR